MHSYDLVIAPLITILSASVAIVVFIKNPKSAVNRTASTIVMSVAFWILFAFLADLPVMAPFSLLFNRLVFVSLVVLFSSLMFLGFVFPEERSNKKEFGILIAFISTALIYFTMWSPYVVSSVQIESFGSNLMFGQLYVVFVSYGVVSLIAPLLLVLVKYKNLSEANKKSSRYFLLGLFSFMFLAVFVHVVVRNIVGSDEYYRFGNYGAIILVGFLAYAVAKHELFNIKVAVTEMMVIVVLTALFVEIFLSTNPLEVITKCILFLISTYGGYVIIKTASFEHRKKLQLETMNKKLQQLDAAKDDFINIASHQLKSPIAILKNTLEREIKEVHTKSESAKQITRLEALVSEILLASKLATKKYEPENLNEMNLLELISTIAEEQKLVSQSHGIQTIVIKHSPNATKEYFGDEIYLREAFQNIIQNAVKYSKIDQRNTITLSLEYQEAAHSFVFTCQDQGIGVKKEDIPKLFSKFSRGSNVHSKSGSGLGLYITKEIIEGHGGSIQLESELGKGTKVTIALPFK